MDDRDALPSLTGDFPLRRRVEAEQLGPAIKEPDLLQLLPTPVARAYNAPYAVRALFLRFHRDGRRPYSECLVKSVIPATQPGPTPRPTEVPTPLPRNLLPALISRGRLLLCLDYDGTLSEITARPSDARPVAFARRFLAALAAHHERIVVAIVSGRDIYTLRQLLDLNRGLLFVGNHGIECADRDGQRSVAPGIEDAAADLDKVRDWMSREVPARAGFVIEDKRLTVALHYRTADPSATSAVRDSLRKFLDRECTRVEILTGNKVDEVVPRGTGGKGPAVRSLLDSMADSDPTPVYFGDVTDEDAFFALRDEGVTVRVGALQRSWARYRVNGPGEVIAVLGDLVSTLEPGGRADR